MLKHKVWRLLDKFLCHFASINKRELRSRQQDEVWRAQSYYRQHRVVVSVFWHHSRNQMLLFYVTRFSSHKQLEFTQLHNARLRLEASSSCSLRVTLWRVCLNELWIKNVSLFLFAVKCLVRKTNKTANFWWKNCRSLGGGGCSANDAKTVSWKAHFAAVFTAGCQPSAFISRKMMDKIIIKSLVAFFFSIEVFIRWRKIWTETREIRVVDLRSANLS